MAPPGEVDDSQESGVAVIGMSGRFPGARDVATFWSNLRGGVESVRFFTEEELRAAGETEERLADPAYVRACAQLADVDRFDAGFWGMSPRDASVFDPQHRFFLECAWEAFENAGYVGEKVEGAVAVFGACGMSEYMIKNLMTNPEVMESVGEWLVRHTGNDTNFLATRVSYELNLRGPSMNVQTACSSSLVAIHLACQSLLGGECDMALAGGSTISPEQSKGYLWKEGEILSPDGHCRAFDAQSAGTTISSATACVLLKRLADAKRDGDTVLAVIRGTAINNDGSEKVGYLAPSVGGQARVIREALALAGVEARELSYVEAHGTGTRIGDPIELAGLAEAFRGVTAKRSCAIGSLKTNIGHTGEAAGASSFVKTVLALQHRELPPSLHFVTPNPQAAALHDGPFYVNATLRPWDAKRRIAGVTGLGAGGTNAHVVVEEAPAAPPSGPSRSHQLVVVSAKTATALDRAAENLAGHLRANPDVPLADVAFTCAVGRKAFRHRRAVVARDAGEAIQALTSDAKREPARVTDAPTIAFLFPGGGAQYAGMARELYATEATFRTWIDRAIAFVQPRLRDDLRSLMFPAPERAIEASKRLEAPSLALPALFATEYALAKLLVEWGVVPSAFLGHSAGEYAAAALAETMSFEDGLALVATRGRLFETLPRGAMLSVALSAEGARARFGDEARELSIAAINAPELCVVSGPTAAIERLEGRLRDAEIETTRVHIDVAAHSSMLDPILAEFEAFCRTIRFSAPRAPFVSNLTGKWVTPAEATDPKYWVEHLRRTVRFEEGLHTLLADGPRALVEVGPGRTLGAFARQQPTTPAAITSTVRHPKEEASDVGYLLAAVGRVWTSGADVDLGKLQAREKRRRVPLPTYPFERERHWIEPGRGAVAPSRARSLRKRSDVGEWFYAPSWRRAAAPPMDAPGGTTWLVLAGGSSLDAPLVARLRALGDRVVTVTPGAKLARPREDVYTLDPASAADYDALVDELRERELLPQRVAHLFALTASTTPRPPWRRPEPPAASYERDQARAFASQAFLVKALARETESLAWFSIADGVQSVGGEAPAHPERATLLGPVKVLSRELPRFSGVAIDVVLPPARSADHERLVDRLARELRATPLDDVVAYRGADRFVQRFDPVRLEPASTPPAWLRDGGTYLITGGLGGIGLAVAEHVAASARRVSLVLVARTPLPDEGRWDDHLARMADDDDIARRIRAIRALRDRGASVMVACADVADREAMRQAIESARARFGSIDGAFHSAGVLDDSLLALREARVTSPVLDAKVKGTLVLDELLGDSVGLLVLFSSVSSILGLPGQADYTAGNAFLDSFAHARRAAGRRVVSVNWNAWREVGMAAALARAGASRTTAGDRAHLETVAEGDHETVLEMTLDRARHWLVGEHVARGGDALVPGTGFLEIMRAAIEHRRESRALELRDVVFLEPFLVAPGESRALRVRVRRDGTSEVAIYGEREDAPNATAKGGYVDATPAPHHDLAAIRARCTVRRETNDDGFLVQPFMLFGPRWGNLRAVDYGHGEAIATLVMPDRFAGELDELRLHPALLDMATGCAQALVPGFDRDKTFYVPFGYQRVLLRRALPARFFSHVRLRETDAKDLAVFDVTLIDPAGDEIAAIEGFTMRRIAAASVLAARRSSDGSRAPATMGAALREGILAHEGVDALDRILAADVSAQVVASSVDLHAWLDDVSPAAHPAALTGAASAAPDAPHARGNLSAAYVAPRTPIERELAAMWRDLLGVKDAGARDDFFELGGQSLVAVRLFARVRKKWGVELPLATLFEAPTIEGCAAVIAAALGVTDAPEDAPEGAPEAGEAPKTASAPPKAAPRWTHLVPIRRGDERPPFFCVHGAGGNVLVFRDLSRAIAREQPFYGLQARGIDGVTPPHETIEEMASAYLAEIRAFCPKGPYLLGGYSGGGLVALEMARALTSVGEKVDLLVLVDTFHPEMPVLLPTMRERFARARKEGPEYVRRALERKAAERRGHERLAEIDRLLARREPIPEELRDDHLTRSFERASRGYRPRAWDGSATLLRAEELEPIYRAAGPTYGWDVVFREGLDVVQVPGNHSNLLLEPNASILVRSLGAALDAAHRRREARERAQEQEREAPVEVAAPTSQASA